MTIICNGNERDVTPYKRLSYDELITLSHGPQVTDAAFTVTYYYKGREKGGILTKGESRALKQGMVFNVIRTNNA